MTALSIKASQSSHAITFEVLESTPPGALFEVLASAWVWFRQPETEVIYTSFAVDISSVQRAGLGDPERLADEMVRAWCRNKVWARQPQAPDPAPKLLVSFVDGQVDEEMLRDAVRPIALEAPALVRGVCERVDNHLISHPLGRMIRSLERYTVKCPD